MQYIKGKKIIEASTKAYDLIYKNNGYKPYKEKIEEEKEIIPDNIIQDEIND